MILTQLLYKNEKVQVFFDGNYFFSCSTDFVLENRLHKDKEVSEKECDSLREKALKENLKIKILSYMYQSLHSKKEIFQKIKMYFLKKYKEELDKNIFEEVWNIAFSKGMYDEENIVKNISDSYLRKKKGIRYIESMLLNKGFSKESIKTISQTMKKESFSSDILSLLEKKGRGKDKKDMKIKANLFRYLMGRGYEYEDVQKAWKEWYRG